VGASSADALTMLPDGSFVPAPGVTHLGVANSGVAFERVQDAVGNVLAVARDQNGCRFLQRKFDEEGLEAVSLVFPEVLEHVTELMVDPFGNYLVQKLLDRCTDDQRLQILQRVSQGSDLTNVSLNTHGTRAVQKLVETISTPEQTNLVVDALKPGVVQLIKDLNGNHVVQRCLQRLGAADAQFIYDAACTYCVEIATHRHGCCVLQRCVDHAAGQQRDRLVREVANHALRLSQDPFGNYVVQYVLDLGTTWACTVVMKQLAGSYCDLSTQKFSSNVVEKCLKLTGNQALEESKNRAVVELAGSPNLGRLLSDPYANYVVQSALTVSKGSVHQRLVDAIRPHLPMLRGTPYSKRIISRSALLGKKPQGGEDGRGSRDRDHRDDRGGGRGGGLPRQGSLPSQTGAGSGTSGLTQEQQQVLLAANNGAGLPRTISEPAGAP